MSIKIYDTEKPEDIARKIYEQFDVHQSCTIMGFYKGEEDLIPKGKVVMDIIEMLYSLEFCRDKGGKQYRVYSYKPNSVGGPIAHKIFTWDKKIINNEIRYTIWRVQ